MDVYGLIFCLCYLFFLLSCCQLEHIDLVRSRPSLEVYFEPRRVLKIGYILNG
jgi:hypothetical protein